MFQLDPMELNNTRKAKRDILFFNRVPKVGSQLTMELLKSLSLKNKFHYHKDKTQKVEVIKLTHSQEVSGDIKKNPFCPKCIVHVMSIQNTFCFAIQKIRSFTDKCQVFMVLSRVVLPGTCFTSRS